MNLKMFLIINEFYKIERIVAKIIRTNYKKDTYIPKNL